MINKIDTNRAALKAEKNVSGSKSAPAASVKNSSSAPSSVMGQQTLRSVSSLVSAAGLPADKISSSIVLFARFFSLPLKHNVLNAIRSQAFLQHKQNLNVSQNASAPAVPNQPSSSSAAKTAGDSVMRARETLSLAAAAAESKGVELNPKGLETYAEAIDTEWRRQKDDDRRQKKQNKDQNEQNEKSLQKNGSVTAAELEKTANENFNANPLLDMLNRLPGKNGQRWITLPFSFYEDDTVFNISMRVLLENESRAVKMALQISVNREQRTENREKSNKVCEAETGQVFVFEFAHNKIDRVIVFYTNEMPVKEQSLIKKELSSLFEIPLDRVFVKISSSSFPCEADSEEKFISIDEAV